MKIMRGFVDETLVAAHVAAKKSQARPDVFLQVHAELVELILPMPQVRLLLQETGSWQKVEKPLQDVVASSKLGRCLFGFALLGRFFCL